MSRPNPLSGSVNILGGRVSRVVLFVILATLVGTILTVNVTTALVLVPRRAALRRRVERLRGPRREPQVAEARDARRVGRPRA